jgi:tetratricopeptide (TPR) repeat protein
MGVTHRTLATVGIDMTTFQPTTSVAAVTPALTAQPEPQPFTKRTASYAPTESYRTWYQRGLFLLEAKHHERALDCFDQALRLDAAQPDVWYTRGEVLANLGQYPEALTCFDQSLVLQAESCKAWVFRAVVLFHLQQFADAVTSCDRALALQPTDPEAWLFRGSALQRLGRYKEAYAALTKPPVANRNQSGRVGRVSHPRC